MTSRELQSLAQGFEAERAHLRAVAYRMLGSLAEADDAVQEAWLRLSRSDASAIENLGGWLTTVVARVCLDVLRSRRSRREEPFVEPEPASEVAVDPEHEALLADSVGLALLVVLETLQPAERVAFVLHDLFALSFEEIAPMLGRSQAATRQLASRARRRVRGASPRDPSLGRQREVVEAFLAAGRGGDFDALLRVLAPDVTLHADRGASASGAVVELHGARAVARGALAASGRLPFARPALVNGAVGVVVAPRGRLSIALSFQFAEDRVAAIDVIADPERLRALEIAVVDA